MSALFRSSIFLALAIAIGVYLYLSLSDEDVTSVPPEAPVASVAAGPVAPVAEAAQADIDDDLVDYLAARQIGSLEGWRAFLTAHGSGLHAQLARAEVEKLLHAEKTPRAGHCGGVAWRISGRASWQRGRASGGPSRRDRSCGSNARRNLQT